jgi:hypothetical protein
MRKQDLVYNFRTNEKDKATFQLIYIYISLIGLH